MDGLSGSWIENAGINSLSNLGDAIILHKYQSGNSVIAAVPERAGVRGRLVIEGDLNRYMGFSRDYYVQAAFPQNAAGEVRLASNIASWLAIGDIDPAFDFSSGCGCGN